MESNNFKVLIVDDIEENLRVVGNILGENNIAILLARGGRQAIKIAQRKLPDLILLDINMPEINGYETCKILKEDEQTKDIPVIFLSALNEKEAVVKGFDYGGVDYITKPFYEAELLSRVFTHLNLKKSRDIITIQNEKLKSQNSKIDEQNKNIVSSINYAKLIQDAVLPSKEFFDQFFPDSFIFYLPKDIVGGDFYWATQIHNKIVLAVADCTGHGVPGALMSMLGMAYLSETFNKFDSDDIRADSVLNELRYRVKVALNQDGQKKAGNGMDIALCIIDIETKKMDYAGAYSPLILIRYNEGTNQNELQEYKADKMPIAVHLKEKPFTNNEMQLNANDMVYLFSDGYADQFGKEDGKKFQRSRFKKLLLDNSNKSMIEQKKALADQFFEWKGDGNQIDDIVVIGVRISEAYGDVDIF